MRNFESIVVYFNAKYDADRMRRRIFIASTFVENLEWMLFVSDENGIADFNCPGTIESQYGVLTVCGEEFFIATTFVKRNNNLEWMLFVSDEYGIADFNCPGTIESQYGTEYGSVLVVISQFAHWRQSIFSQLFQWLIVFRSLSSHRIDQCHYTANTRVISYLIKWHKPIAWHDVGESDIANSNFSPFVFIERRG